MIRRSTLLALLISVALGALTACALLSPEASFAPSHPQALETGRPMCSECHGKDLHKGGGKTYASYDHTVGFAKEHKVPATQDAATCASCHAPSFCSDCHAGKTVLSPAVKLGNRPDRLSPHKAGYLNLHKLEGRMDPTGCYKCHGRANNGSCRACHR